MVKVAETLSAESFEMSPLMKVMIAVLASNEVAREEVAVYSILLMSRCFEISIICLFVVVMIPISLPLFSWIRQRILDK